MNLKHIALAVLAGIAAFLIVGIAVTELLSPRIEFSLFVGIPAGLLAGVVTVIAVALGLGRDEPGTRRVAVAFGIFGAVFVVATVLVGGLGGRGVLVSMLVGVVVGIVAGAASYRRGRTARPPSTA